MEKQEKGKKLCRLGDSNHKDLLAISINFMSVEQTMFMLIRETLLQIQCIGAKFEGMKGEGTIMI